MSSDGSSPMEPDPFAELLGMEIMEMKDGYAKGKLALGPDLSSTPDSIIAHGGVPYALADHTGGAAAVSTDNWPTPTIDMRIDYLNPVTEDLFAEAEVIRAGRNFATVSVVVTTQSDGAVAVGRGVYKIGSVPKENPWHGE